MKKRFQPEQACCQKNSPGANFRVSPAGVRHRDASNNAAHCCTLAWLTDLQRKPPFNSNGGDPSGSGRVSVGLRACEKIPPRLRAPLIVPGGVAGPPISGHVELATLPDIGTPAPCLTRPRAPSLRAGIISQALKAEREVKPGKIQARMAEFSTVSQQSGQTLR
jgi:hypothetical protein